MSCRHPDCEIRHGIRVAARRVEYQDVALSCMRDIHVLYARAQNADHLQPLAWAVTPVADLFVQFLLFPEITPAAPLSIGLSDFSHLPATPVQVTGQIPSKNLSLFF